MDTPTIIMDASGVEAIAGSMPFNVGGTLRVTDNSVKITEIAEKAEDASKANGLNSKEQMVASIKKYNFTNTNGQFEEIDYETEVDSIIYTEDEYKLKAIDSKNSSQALSKQIDIWNKYEKKQDRLTEEAKTK